MIPIPMTAALFFYFLIALLLCVLIGLVVFLLLKLKTLTQPQQQEQLLENLIHQTFGKTVTLFSEQNQQLMQKEKEVIHTDLHNKYQQIQTVVTQLQQQLTQRDQEHRSRELSHSKTLASLQQAIESHQNVTQQLQVTSQTLAKVLSNNQLRGSWGERIIEEVLISSGLQEGVHYALQTTLENTQDRPDVLLFLPNKKVVPVDVKFPFVELQHYAESEQTGDKEKYLNKFRTDIKQKIKKIASYIQPEHDTVDYAVWFVPNEFVFSFMNQKLPDLMNQAFQSKVLIVSPFTFIVVAHTIMESYKNFALDTNLRHILKHIQEFSKEWERYMAEFRILGESIAKTERAFQKIAETRHHQLTRRIEKIEDYRSQHLEKSASHLKAGESDGDADGVATLLTVAVGKTVTAGEGEAEGEGAAVGVKDNTAA